MLICLVTVMLSCRQINSVDGVPIAEGLSLVTHSVQAGETWSQPEPAAKGLQVNDPHCDCLMSGPRLSTDGAEGSTEFSSQGSG